jgi:sugar phosphate permease
MEIFKFLCLVLGFWAQYLSFLVAKFGWKMAFFVPATLAIFIAIWLFNRLRDKPQSLGLPDIESYREEVTVAQKQECEADTRSYVQVFKDDILFNKTIWLLAIAYVFVYVIRIPMLIGIRQIAVHRIKRLVESKAHVCSYHI